MSHFVLFGLALTTLTLASTPIGAAPIQSSLDACVIEVEGRVFVDGPCVYVQDRMLVILNTESNKAEPYVYLGVGDGLADANAWWTGEEWAGRAHSPLGDLTRDGPCWVSDYARICLPAAAIAKLENVWSAMVAESSPPFPFTCLIRLDGVNLLDGPCPGESEDVAARVNSSPLTRNPRVSVGDLGSGEGIVALLYDERRSDDPQSLGVVSRQGDCWVNDRARICMTAVPAPAP